MARIDHHIKPYDEGTLVKLEIFESYVETWLPTFITQKHIHEICIVDFFAGIGYDQLQQKGSPIRILDRIDAYFALLMNYNTKITLYLNEYKSHKFKLLKENCEEYLQNHKRLSKFVEIHYLQKDFNDIYDEILNVTKDKPSLFIIDQNGIKFTSKEVFNSLLKTDKTDFLFFISSSFFKRFNTTEEFNKHLNITEEELNRNPYKFIHRTVLEAYRSLIPSDSTMMIYPFSIKKNANIYGIVFGSKHILGVKKFLDIAWSKNKINGDANFDIDDDLGKSQLTIFQDEKRVTKIEGFEILLEKYIEEKKEVTNAELFNFTYLHGHIYKHTSDWLKKVKNIKVEYSGHTYLTWENIKKGKVVKFKYIH